jgi:hypothetical protein
MGEAVPASTVLDVALGLIFVYLIFSVAVSRLSEFVSSKLQLRYTGLTRGIRGLLEGGADRKPPPEVEKTLLTAEKVLRHPTVKAMSGGLSDDRKPSYLPSRTFAAAVVDLLAPPAEEQLDSIDREALPAAAQPRYDEVAAAPTTDSVKALLAEVPEDDPQHDTINAMMPLVARDPLEQAREKLVALPPNHPAKKPLLRILSDACGDRDRFYQGIERWYDDAMARMSGWYMRRIRFFLLAFGAALTIAFNIDTINIAQVLWRAPSDQAAIAGAASNAAGATIDNVSTSVHDVAALNLPLGWTAPHTEGDRPGTTVTSSDPRRVPSTVGDVLLKILGLALTAIALSFGATFWFDVLGKVARLRNTGDRPPPAPAPVAAPALTVAPAASDSPAAEQRQS